MEGLIKELAGRVKGISVALRKQQKGHIRKVAGKLSLGLIAICCIFMCWPGWKVPQRFVTGFQVINLLELSGIWKLVENPAPCSEQELLLENAKVVGEEKKRPLCEDAQFLWDSVCKEHTKGVGAEPVHHSKMDEIYGAGK